MATITREYEPIPADNRKGFYGKCRVYCYSDDTEELYSYHTRILRRNADGSLTRFWPGWSMTTGRHIRAFCGLSKSEFCALPISRS